MYGDDARNQCLQAVNRIKDQLREAKKRRVFSTEDDETLVMCILTMNFFLSPLQPFTRLAIDRLDKELEICQNIMDRYTRA